MKEARIPPCTREYPEAAWELTGVHSQQEHTEACSLGFVPLRPTAKRGSSLNCV